MKFLFLAAWLLPAIAHTQDCKLTRETDPFTKEKKISSGFIGLNGASVTIDADSKEIVILFSLEGQEKCLDNNSTADVYFDGLKGKTQSRNQGTMNCEGLFQFVFRNGPNAPPTMLDRIMNRKVTQIIFTGNSKKPITVTLSPTTQDALMKLAGCVVTEAKTLL